MVTTSVTSVSTSDSLMLMRASNRQVLMRPSPVFRIRNYRLSCCRRRLLVISRRMSELATKQDLEQATTQLRGEMKHDLEQATTQLRGEMKHDLEQATTQLRGEMKHDLEQATTQLRGEMK